MPEPSRFKRHYRIASSRFKLSDMGTFCQLDHPSPPIPGALRLRERAKEIREMFPLGAFPPQLPFAAAA